MSEVKQSINKIQVVGEVSEINLKDETVKTKIRGNGKEQEVTCGVISKADFKAGAAMTVKVEPKDDDGNVRFSETIGIEFYAVKEKKFDDKGNLVDNPRYQAFQTIMKYEKGTRVKIDGSLNMNEYASSKDSGKNYDFHSIPQVNAFQITSSNVPEEDMAEGSISGIIQKIVPEMRTKNEAQEETGRSLVELYFFDNQGHTTPNTFVVNKDIADEFSDTYEAGQSVKLLYEIYSRHVGGITSGKQAFGHRSSQITSGFTVMEYQIFGGDAPFEEENEYYIELSTMKEAKAARQNYIDTMIDDKKKSDKEGKNSGGSVKKSGLGNRASKVKEEEFHSPDGDEELPF